MPAMSRRDFSAPLVRKEISRETFMSAMSVLA
jgi:hypothetical protein